MTGIQAHPHRLQVLVSVELGIVQEQGRSHPVQAVRSKGWPTLQEKFETLIFVDDM